MKTRFSQILLNSPPLFILLLPSPASFLALMAWKLCAFPSTHNGAAPASTGGAARTAQKRGRTGIKERLPHMTVPADPFTALPAEETTTRTRVADTATPAPQCFSMMSLQVVAIFRNDRASVATRALHCVWILPTHEFSSCSCILFSFGGTA